MERVNQPYDGPSITERGRYSSSLYIHIQHHRAATTMVAGPPSTTTNCYQLLCDLRCWLCNARNDARVWQDTIYANVDADSDTCTVGQGALFE